jgi:microcystin-dependent protein
MSAGAVPEVPVPVGSLVPVGTVIAYAGNAEDPLVNADLRNEGWLLCDGSQLSQKGYPFLYQRIGSRYGANAQDGTFRLPDYRGQFLRGVSGTSGRDPDTDKRTPPPNGSPRGAGSTQASATRRPENFSVQSWGQHSHSEKAPHAHQVAQYRWNGHIQPGRVEHRLRRRSRPWHRWHA